MSIIFDALKKVQLNRSENSKEQHATDANPTPIQPLSGKTKTQQNPKLIILYILVSVSGILLAKFFYDYIAPKKPLKQTQAQVSATATTAADTTVTVTVPVKTESPAPPMLKKIALPQLSLNGIFFSDKGRYALINNRILREGDVVEGAVIKRINADSVEAEKDGQLFKLSAPSK